MKTGITFLQALCLLFIGLKLSGYIAWSWWLVFAPVWIPFTINVCVGFVKGYSSAVRLGRQTSRREQTERREGKGGSKVGGLH